MNKRVKIVLSVLGIVFLLYSLTIRIVPKIIDKSKNKIRIEPPYSVSDDVQNSYNKLDFIADMHCDALLWKRDLLKDNNFGQVDIPKLIKANVGLQTFTIVTKSPKGQNFKKNIGDTDNITGLYFVQGRPMKSLTNRAISQCDDLFKYAKKSKGKFRVILSSNELNKFVADKKSDKRISSGIIGIEGAHALDGDLKNVKVLFDHGVRMMAPTHFFDNKLGGSAHGVSGAGLTNFGKDVINKMVELNMIIDVAHASPQIIDDIFELTNKPVISSHTGVKGTCDNVRNLSDKHIKAIAKSDGLVCIALFKQAVCGEDAKATAKAIKYTADLVGVKYVALGSDFDGSVITPFNITGLPLIVQELLDLNFNEEEIKMIMGENIKRFLLKNLPE